MKKATKWISRIVIALLAVLAIGVATCVALVYLKPKISEEKKPEPEPEAVVEPKPISATANYLFAGTTFWGRRTNTMARASDLGVKYPFSQLGTLNRDEYDAWIAGLECPLVEKGGVHNSYEEESIFKFNCDPDYLEVAKDYFTAFLLGNNHAGNQGKEGLDETKQHLAENGIQYFGTPKRTGPNVSDPEFPNDAEDANNCGVVVLPLNITLDNDEKVTYQMPFGFCSAHGVYGIPGDDYLNNMKTFAGVLPTIAMPHMGAEYKSSHDTIRQNLYRKMIDYGVEMVIGDHPHWTQDTEAYNGKLIVYSMGNFMFDQTSNKEVSRSATITVELEIANINDVDLEAWDILGQKCLEDKVTCFDEIQKADLTRPEYKYKFGYIGTTSAENRITRRASDAEQVEIGQRLQWDATMRALGQ